MGYKYLKSDLIYKDYKWTAYPSDDPKVTGAPDNTLFNRHEGYEVLYLINHFELSSRAPGEKLEKMIRNELPSDVRGQIKVRDWLKENWTKSKL